jgi:hypothetical protein
MANNLLATFGIPSLSSFEDKMANDEKFRDKVANDPTMSSYIAQNSSEANFQSPEETSGGGMDPLGGLMSIAGLKMLARLYT